MGLLLSDCLAASHYRSFPAASVAANITKEFGFVAKRPSGFPAVGSKRGINPIYLGIHDGRICP
jgi:hypothetical protein